MNKLEEAYHNIQSALNLEIEQLRKERDELRNKNDNQFYTLTEIIKDLKETSKQLQAEKQKNEEILTLLKLHNKYKYNGDGYLEEIEQLLTK